MKLIFVYFIHLLVFMGCTQSEPFKINQQNNKRIEMNYLWIERIPDIVVEYQTGYTQNDSVLVPGDFYLVTNYSPSELEVFQNYSDDEICNLLSNPKTQTNCILLLHQTQLIPCLEYENVSYDQWVEIIVPKQLSAWKAKYKCS